MIMSCEKCGKTIIQDNKGKVLVGCEHCPIGDGIPEFLKGFVK
jgi:hypothetical protein